MGTAHIKATEVCPQYTGLYKLELHLIWAPAHIKAAEVCPY